MMNMDTLQETTHFRGDYGVHTIETIPIPLRIVLTWLNDGKIVQDKGDPIW